MKVRVLALNVDRSIAADDGLDARLADAVRDARRAGLMVVMVSGRLAAALEPPLTAAELFDAFVVEGGAVLHMPGSASPTLLARAPNAAVVAALHERGIPHRIGHCIVEADLAAAGDVMGVLYALRSPHGITFDGARLSVLPHGVNKALGVGEAVWRLGASLHNTIAIGCADDDQSLLDACEIGVPWGSSVLRRVADEDLSSGTDAVAEYVRKLIDTDPVVPRRERRSGRALRIGTRATGEPVDVEIRLDNVLFAGDPRSGKTWLVSLLCERLILERYALCVVDPEGDYTCLEALPGVIVHRVDHADPLADLERALRQPALSVVLDLSGLPGEHKADAVRALLPRINALRRAFGVPHRVVLDEAHYFLNRVANPDVFDPGLGGSYLVTYRSGDLAPGVLDACDTIVATRIADRRVAARLLEMADAAAPHAEWIETLASLAIGEAVLLRSTREGDQGIIRFALERRVTNHVRHRVKYADVGVPPGREFVFTRDGRKTEHRVRTLREFLEAIPAVPADVFAAHLARGDFHRWIEDVVGDRDLGKRMRGIEHGDLTSARERIVRAIRDRYLEAEVDRWGRGSADGPAVAGA